VASDLLRLLLSFVVIIVAAELFTNGVEWLGVRLSLSEGAVGSVLAAVGTAMPETLIPAVALLFFRQQTDHEVGLGAILGAPFMLATLGFLITALAAFGYRRRREHGARLAINRDVASRDVGFFLPLYTAAIAISLTPVGHWSRYVVVAGLITGYVYYLVINLRETAEGAKEEPLVFDLVWVWMALVHPTADDRHGLRRARRELIASRPPALAAVLGQVGLALLLILLGAYVFVEAVRNMALLAGISPLIFALIVAPVATELPEKLNSVIWVRQGKDTLSLGNISGAMVFQATFPVTLGMLLTDWHFGADLAGRAGLLSAAIALGSAAILLVSLRLGRTKTISSWPLLLGGLWWAGYLIFVLTNVIR